MPPTPVKLELNKIACIYPSRAPFNTLLATFPDYHHGLDLGLPLLELGLSEAPEVATTYTRELASENGAWIWTASASTA
jgi:hypothetical protein